MYEELMRHILTFKMGGYKMLRLKKDSYYKGDIVKDYIETYYKGAIVVPVGVLNPLMFIIDPTAPFRSLYYSNKKLKSMGLVRDRRDKSYLITTPNLMVDVKDILEMKPMYKYSALIGHLVLSGAIKDILNFYSSEVSKLIK